MSEWISVEDRLPDIDEEVLVCHHSPHGDSYISMGWVEISRFGDNRWFTHEEELNASHWMPLPEPPRSKDDE